MSEVRHFMSEDFDLTDYDPTEHDSDEDRTDKRVESKVGSGEVRNSVKKKRWVNGKSSRLNNTYNEDKIIRLATNNHNKMAILRCLYVHRQMDMFQINRVAVPQMHRKSVGNLLAEMYAQRLLNRDILLKASRAKGDEKKFHYRLAKLGLYIISTFDLHALWHYSHPDVPKQHYLLQNLAIGSQQSHHFETQEFLSRLIHNLAQKNIVFPHSDWKRYPIQDYRLNGKNTPYRPDWFIFKPNEFFTTLVRENRTSECPLHVPVESRSEEEKALLLKHYEGFLSIECDLKTEDLREIEDKCKKFAYALEIFPQNNLAFFSVNGWYENDILLPAPKTHTQMRGRNTRRVIIKHLEDVLITDKTNVLHGDEHTCRLAAESFIEQNGDMLLLYPKQDFSKHVDIAPSTLDHEMLYFTDDLKRISLDPPLPVFPDEVVRVRRHGGAETHMIFFTKLGWVNPIAKALKMQRWIDEGKQRAKVILVYPNLDEMDSDIHFTEQPFLYVNWEDVQRSGVWGHYKKPMYRKLRNVNTLIWEDVID